MSLATRRFLNSALDEAQDDEKTRENRYLACFFVSACTDTHRFVSRRAYQLQ
jgi:hypothetical protein